MRILAALVLGYYMVVGRVGAEAGTAEVNAPRLPEGMTSAALTEVDRALGVSLALELKSDDADTPQRSVAPGRVLFIPEGCRSVQEPYDLLIHFHGAPTAMEPAFEKSGIGGVLLLLNLGNGSGKYEEAFPIPRSFDDLLTRAAAVVENLCPNAAKTTRRIALSAWSAGYGSIWKIIDYQKNANRVDAVLLADGLHAGFDPAGKRQRLVNGDQMAAFTLFADRAVAGEKLMAITHSAITTPYASTTETAGFLLAEEDVPRVKLEEQGPRVNMMMRSRADRGGLHVMGFEGNDKSAHCDHLLGIGETLLPLLHERWSR